MIQRIEMTGMKRVALFAIIACSLSTGIWSYAKIRIPGPPQPKSIEAHLIKDIKGEATLTLQKQLGVPQENGALQFQDGKIAENVEFYKSPRCYLHFRKNSDTKNGLSTGQTLRASKIDNIYQNGSVHVTFWFDQDQTVSDLACITNYDHTLTGDELKSTLGNLFQVFLTKSVENNALFNTAPNKNAGTLPEDSTNNTTTQSARFILSDS